MLMSRDLATQLLRTRGTRYRLVYETDLFGGVAYNEYTVGNDPITITDNIEIFYKGSYRKVEPTDE